MFGLSNDKIGAAAGESAVNALKSNPDLVNQIVSAAVTALVEAVIKNIPAMVAGIQQAIADAKAAHPAK